MTTATSPDRTAWREAIADIAEKAKQTLPECNGRVDKAVALVLNGDVELLPDGHAKVASQAHGTLSYRIVNGACDCRDYAQAPSHWCKHRIAAGLLKRVEARLQATAPGAHDDHGVPPRDVPIETPHGIDPRHIVLIQGKPFVKFAGLLELAHKRGLQELRVAWTYNDAELSLAHAVAVFPFGTFADCGDATPGNVTRKVAPHFRRCALTRASARALRLALGLDMVSYEELGED
jgi:hypothetical protein